MGKVEHDYSSAYHRLNITEDNIRNILVSAYRNGKYHVKYLSMPSKYEDRVRVPNEVDSPHVIDILSEVKDTEGQKLQSLVITEDYIPTYRFSIPVELVHSIYIDLNNDLFDSKDTKHRTMMDFLNSFKKDYSNLLFYEKKYPKEWVFKDIAENNISKSKDGTRYLVQVLDFHGKSKVGMFVNVEDVHKSKTVDGVSFYNVSIPEGNPMIDVLVPRDGSSFYGEHRHIESLLETHNKVLEEAKNYSSSKNNVDELSLADTSDEHVPE